MVALVVIDAVVQSTVDREARVVVAVGAGRATSAEEGKRLLAVAGEEGTCFFSKSPDEGASERRRRKLEIASPQALDLLHHGQGSVTASVVAALEPDWHLFIVPSCSAGDDHEQQQQELTAHV